MRVQFRDRTARQLRKKRLWDQRLLSPDAQQMNNKIFSGKYEVKRELGRGGMGVIYEALHTSLNRTVAIKVLHSQYTGDQAFLKRFQREARAMARLDHENIIKVFDVSEDHGSHYIVMEFFSGKDLRKIILERGAFQAKEALSIAIQVAEALSYAHSKGIIHRDVKPANIIVNQRRKVKIADFGIAAATDEVTVTATGHIIGTPEYMSVEQAQGEQLDGRSDLYSLGMVIYEMLTGHTSYQGISRMAILGKLVYDPEEFDLSFPSQVPSSLQDLVRTLLKKKKGDRVSDAVTLIDLMEGIKPDLEGGPVLSESAEATGLAEIPAEDNNETGETQILIRSPSTSEETGTQYPTPSPSRLREIENPSSPSGVSEPFPPTQTRLPLQGKSAAGPKWIFFISGASLVLMLLAGIAYYLSFNDNKPPAASPALPSPVNAIKEIQTIIRKAQIQLSRSRESAEGADAPRWAEEAYVKAVDIENRATKKLEDADELINNKQFNEAKRPLEAALDLLKQARAGFINAKNITEQGNNERIAQIEKLLASIDTAKGKTTNARRAADRADASKLAKKTYRNARNLEASTTKKLEAGNRLFDDGKLKEAKQRLAPLPSEFKKAEKGFIDAKDASTQSDIDLVGNTLEKLKMAYENRDLPVLQKMSEMSQDRTRFLEQIFRDYRTIDISIKGLSLTGDSAEAVVSIRNLIQIDGNRVFPSPKWKEARVVIHKKGGKWGKVVW